MFASLFLIISDTFLHPGRSTHQGLILDWDKIFLVANLPQIAMAVTFVS